MGIKRTLAAAVAVLAHSSIACAQGASLPVDPGESVITHFSGFNGFSVALVNTTDPAGQGAPLGGAFPSTNWLASRYSNGFPGNPTNNPADVWNAANLGQVFGVVLDDASPPNIYVAASTVYGNLGFGPGGNGGEVYRIDGVNGQICKLAMLPNSGQGLGNIAFDPVSKQLYISDFEDGKIYAVPALLSGPCRGPIDVVCNPGVTCYDHGVVGRPQIGSSPIPDNAALGFTQRGRRVWGVAVHQSRLFYSVWWEDARPGGQSSTEANEIWSVGLTATGTFVPNSSVREFLMPPGSIPSGAGPLLHAADSQVIKYSNPVSDIHFSESGHMFLAERTRLADVGTLIPSFVVDAHSSRVIELTGASPAAWTFAPLNKWKVGYLDPMGDCDGASLVPEGTNSAGGVSTDCDGNVFATGDALFASCVNPNLPYIYGLMIIPAGGNVATLPLWSSLSYLIDSDGFTGTQAKTGQGDVAVRPDCKCADIKTASVACMPNGQYAWTFSFTNNSGVPASVLILPDPSMSPNVIPLSPPVGSGSTSAPITVTITGQQPGTPFCFDFILGSIEGNECCHLTHCIDLPDCVCGQVLQPNVVASSTPGTFQLSFTFTNLATWSTGHVVFVPPSGTSITPSIVNLGPIPPFGSQSVGPVTVVTGLPPGSRYCFTVGNHSENWLECCFFEVCVTVPGSSNTSGNPADLNADGVVDSADLGILLSVWHTSGGAADLDHDGVVSAGDLGLLLSAWG